MLRFAQIYILALLALALASPAAFAAKGPFDIELELSKDTVFVGDEFNLTLTIIYTSELGKVEIDQPEFPELAEFEKVGTIGYSQSQRIIQNSYTKKPESESTYSFRRTYRALKPGEFKFPPIEIKIKDPAQPMGTLNTRTNTVTIKVLDLSEKPPEAKKPEEPKKEEGLRDIKAPVPAPMWILYLFAVGGSSIVLVLALVLAKALKPSLSKPPSEKPRVIENPFEHAMSRLDELKLPSPNAADDDITAFYIRLTEIVKEYLAKHHGVMGFEATSYEITSEMRDAWKKVRRKDELIRSLEVFLSEVDLGRYAKGRREQDHMRHAIDRARAFIKLDNEITVTPQGIQSE